MPEMIWVVAAALVDPAGRVLVQRRPVSRQHGGLWELPGGKIEPGEAPAAALVRELAEELAVTVAPDALMPVTFASEPPIVLLVYLCRVWTGDIRSADGAALRWCALDELDDLSMPPADRPLAAALKRLL